MKTIHDEPWHHLPPEQVIAGLESESQRGLARAEVERRQRQFGPNALPPLKGPGPLVTFLLQFHQALVYILIACGIIFAI